MSTRADFDFMERIGRGASSVVYKAKRKADGQIYCIKEIDLSVVTSEEEEGALREVQVPIYINVSIPHLKPLFLLLVCRCIFWPRLIIHMSSATMIPSSTTRFTKSPPCSSQI